MAVDWIKRHQTTPMSTKISPREQPTGRHSICQMYEKNYSKWMKYVSNVFFHFFLAFFFFVLWLSHSLYRCNVFMCMFLLLMLLIAANNRISGFFFIILSFFCCYEKWNIKRCISKSTSIVIPAIFIRSTFFFGCCCFLATFLFQSILFSPYVYIYTIQYFFSDELFEHVTDPKVSITQKHLFIVFNSRWRWKKKQKSFCISRIKVAITKKKNKECYNNKFCNLSKLIQRWHISL